MTRLSLLILMPALAVVALGTATAQQPPAGKPGTVSNLVTLVGCVSANPNQPGGFMLSEIDQVSQYKLTGTSMRGYAGKRVEISGEPPKRLKITGGLVPTPNVAAQGGHDHVKEAMAAATPANRPGGAALPELRVKSVREVTGECAAR
jgi:hypothetical protein